MLDTEAVFGAWLRHRRRQLDLTQTELAQQVGCSVVTIRKLERNELRPSKQLAERLAHCLAIPVTHQASVIGFARATAFPVSSPDALPAQSHVRSNIAPEITPFFGRTTELLELTQVLTDPTCRLLTLVGPGGMGKTRLALEVALANLDVGLTVSDSHAEIGAPDNPTSKITNPKFKDGIYFIALAPLRTHEHIMPAIAEAINFRFQADSRLPKQQLLDYLRHKQMLLLLDNFEHLREGAGLIHELLQASSGLRLLVTSRERLQLSSEHVFVLDSLDCPTQALLQTALTSSAVQLFVERVRRTRPKFTLDAANVQDVVRICRLVGGMPLGIILAAAWIELLTPAEIAAELSRGFDFLAVELQDIPDRQRSMRTILASSWQRLTEAERAVFMRLAVFRGGFTRQAAQSVAGASLQLLSTFVNKSMLQCEPSGRYTIHELLRQYAETELESAGQTSSACTAHSTYYTDYLHQRVANIKGRRQVAALDEIKVDFENVRAAWLWAVARRDYAAVDRALEGLYWFCEIKRRFQQGLELLRLAREQLAPVVDEQPHFVWGRVMARMLGQDSIYYEPLTESRKRVETGLAIAQKYDDRAEVAFCLWRLAVAVFLCEDVHAAIPYFEQSLAHYRGLNDHFYLAYLLKDLGMLYLRLDQPDKGIHLIEQSLDLRRNTDDVTGLMQSFGTLGWIAYNSGRYAEAETNWQSAQQLRHTNIIDQEQVNSLTETAWLAFFNRGDLGTVRTLVAEIQAIARDINDPLSQHRARILSGFLAGMDEDYQTCCQCFQQVLALNFPYFPYTTSWVWMGLCLTACGLDDIQVARQHLQKILEISLIHRWPSNASKGLTFAAILAAKTGRPERATELLGLISHHPLSPKGWLEKWPLLIRLRAELAATLTQEAFTTAWAGGTQLDLMATAEIQLAELMDEKGLHKHTKIELAC